VLLTYNRNCVLHLLALPSLVASFFVEHGLVGEAALMGGCLELYPFLRRELFLRWSQEEAEGEIRRIIDVFVERRMLVRDADRGVLRRPPVTTPEFGSLSGLGHIMRETFERYCMTTVLLAENLPHGYIERGEFEQQCHLLAQRMAILSGRSAPEFFDKALFSNYIDTMKGLGLLRPDAETGDQHLVIDRQVQQRAVQSMQHLSVEVQQRIRRLISRPRPREQAPAG
jgi:glycerol-3-phosphate O-acyltransferase